MSSSTGDIGINGNLNVSNTLNSSGLTVNSGTVNFTGAAFTNSCIPSAAISGGSSNASTIAVANDQSLTLTGAYIPYCGVTNTNVALKTNPGLRYNAVNGTLSAILFSGNATTQSTTDNSTSLATTEFVQNNILSLSSIYASISSLSNYLTIAASSTFAPLANPIFTGTPKSTTPVTSDNSTNIATTAYVQNNINNLLINGVYYPFSASPYIDLTATNAYNSVIKAYTISGPLYATYSMGFLTYPVYLKLPLPSVTYNGITITFRHTVGTGGTNNVYFCTSATPNTTTGTSFMNIGNNGPIITGYFGPVLTSFTYLTFVCLPNNTAYYWCLMLYG